MKLSSTFNMLAWMAFGSHALALPAASPYLNIEITVKSGDLQGKDTLITKSTPDRTISLLPKYAVEEQTVLEGATDGSDNVHQVQSSDEYDQLKNGSDDKLVVVDFSAVWCGPCRAIAPSFSSLSNTYTNVVFIAVDIDKLSKLPDGADVSGVPTFKYFRNGNLLTQFSGASAQKLEDTIKANL